MTKRPLRVFHLIKGLGRGGAEMLLTDGPRASDPANFQYGFGYFLPHKDALVSELETHVGEVTCFSAATPFAMSARVVDVARHVKRWGADVIHCHLPLAGVVGRLAGRLARIPVVYTEHNLIERYHPATRLAARLTWRMQRHVIAVSTEVGASVGRHLGDRIPLTVIPNAVSVERFATTHAGRSAARSKLNLPDGAPVIGTVAVFRKQKRLDLWLNVAREILTVRPDARFLLIGDGPLRAEVEEQARALGLQHALHLPGLQTDVRPYLAAMDAYLMTSDFEGLPLALLEAMASRLTPVATAVGGIKEVIESGKNGFLLPQGDTAGLVKALQHVLDADACQRRAWGDDARTRVTERFSTARLMRQTERVYADVIRH